MQPGLSRISDPYNLYAKAFPGIVFFIFVLSLLPRGSLAGFGQSGSLFALALLILVLGFVFGQVIHSVSGFIESSVYVTLRGYYSILVSIKQQLFGSENNGGGDELPELTRFDKARLVLFPTFVIVATIVTGDLSILFAFLAGIAVSILGPMAYFRRKARAVLTPHRDIFLERLSKDDDLAKVFTERISNSVGPGFESSKEDTYLLAMSQLEFEGAGRARLFQAIFSFSRSLWVILAFYSLIYLIIGLDFNPPSSIPAEVREGLLVISSYQPTITTIVGDNSGMVFTGFMLMLASLLFLRSEARYKELYVEYVIADYLTLSQKREN